MKRLSLLTLAIALVSLQLQAGSGWHKTIESAQKEAKKKNQLILVDMFADWCGWCHRMEREVFPSEAFQKETESMVLLKLDTEDRGEGTRFAQQMGVTTLPMFLLLTPDLELAGSIQGFAPADRFAQQLRKTRDDHEAFRRDLAQEPKLPVERRLALSQQLLMRRQYADAEQRLTRLSAEKNLSAEVRADVFYHLAVAQYHQKKHEPSLKSLDTVTRVAKDGKLGEHARFLRSQILLEQGNKQGALTELKNFRSSYPASELLMAVNRLIIQLEGPAGVRAP